MVAWLHRLRAVWVAFVTLGIITILGMSIYYGKSLSAVNIRLMPGQKDHLDLKVPGRPQEERLPDYTVDILVHQDHLNQQKWVNLGTVPNRSAKNWLRYPVADPPGLWHVQRVRVSDKDLAMNDLLEESPCDSEHLQGKMFEYKFETQHSLKAGMQWFFETPLGRVIAGAVFLAVFVLILSVFV